MEKGLWDLELQVHGCQEEGSLFAGGLTAPPGVPQSGRPVRAALHLGEARPPASVLARPFRRGRGGEAAAAGALRARRRGKGARPPQVCTGAPPPLASSGFLLKHTIGYILTNIYSHESIHNTKHLTYLSSVKLSLCTFVIHPSHRFLPSLSAPGQLTCFLSL